MSLAQSESPVPSAASEEDSTSPLLKPLLFTESVPQAGENQIKPWASHGKWEPPGDLLFLHSSATQMGVEWTLVVPIRDNVCTEWQLQLRVECRGIEFEFWICFAMQ